MLFAQDKSRELIVYLAKSLAPFQQVEGGALGLLVGEWSAEFWVEFILIDNY